MKPPDEMYDQNSSRDRIPSTGRTLQFACTSLVGRSCKPQGAVRVSRLIVTLAKDSWTYSSSVRGSYLRHNCCTEVIQLQITESSIKTKPNLSDDGSLIYAFSLASEQCVLRSLLHDNVCTYRSQSACHMA